MLGDEDVSKQHYLQRLELTKRATEVNSAATKAGVPQSADKGIDEQVNKRI